MRTTCLFLAFAAALALPTAESGAAPKTAPPHVAESVADPGFIQQYADTYRFRNGQPASIRIAPDGGSVLFLRSESRSFERDLFVFDTRSGEERVLLTAEKILAGAEEEISAEERARRERMRIMARGIVSYSLSNDGGRVLVPLAGRLFVVEMDGGAVKELVGSKGAPLDPRFSPGGDKVALVRGQDLYVFDVDSGKERRLTTTTEEGVRNGLAEFVAQEEMGRYHGYWWSPDGAYVAFERYDERPVETLWISDPNAPAQKPTPWRYPRPGKANVDATLGIVPAAGGAPVWVEWDRERYPYIATVRWSGNGPLSLLVQDRRQEEALLLAVDPATGETRELLRERDAAWLNIDQSVPAWLPDGAGFLWSTERDGGWALEQRAADGALVRTLVPAGSGYRDLLSVDAESAWFRASADPTETHVWRVPLAGGEAERITSVPGEHGAVVSGDGKLWIQVARPKAGDRRTVVRWRNGKEVGELAARTEKPSFTPSVEYHMTEGDRRYQTAIVRPRNFEAGRLYPVVLEVYGGPHVRMASGDRARFLMKQWIADHGFIVVSVDGRGTPGRGRAWERALDGDMGVQPVADQVAALQALGEKYPEIDLNRVGVWGWSYGGYMAAMAVMQRPDFFKAGLAVAPVVDWMDYDSHYTERYLGLPAEKAAGYEKSSLLTWADKLDRPLRIVHGTADDNVYFFHSLKLTAALFEAGKRFEFVPVVGQAHSIPAPAARKSLFGGLVRFFGHHL